MYTVKQARQLSGKTQKEIANQLGVCRDTYRSIEKDPEKATIKQAFEFCEVVGIPIDQIFFGKSSTLSRTSEV